MNKQINKTYFKNLVAVNSFLCHRLLRHIFILSIFLATFSIPAFSQTEKFDIITYKTPSKDWTKEIKQGVINYTNINATTGSFCVIAIYGNSASTGDPQKDFSNEWNELVVTPYQADANPTTEIQTTADGWKTVVGAAPVKLNGTDVYIILTVFSGFGKTVSVRASLNNQSYSPQIDALLASMKIDKTKSTYPSATPVVLSQTNNASGKFGLMSWSSPAGWSEQKFPDGVVFKPLDISASEHLTMQIMQPLNASGTLEQALAQSFTEATTMYNATSMYQADGKYSKNASYKSFNDWEYIRGKGGIKVNDGTQFGTEYGLELFVIKVNNRFERVAIFESRANCGGISKRFYASDRIKYRNDIEHLLFSLQFSDFNTTPLKPGSVNGNGIVGVWQGVIQSGGVGVNLDVNSLILFDNGQVYYGPHFPEEGLNEINTRIRSELNKRDWKTYTTSNGSGMLKMIYADIPFRLDRSNLILTKNQTSWPFVKMNSVDGAKFSGTYVMSESYGKIPTITFSTDGSFTDNGALKVLCHEYIECVNPASNPGSGRYDVKDYSILFNYNDGRKVKIAFLGTGYNKNNPSPAILRMSYDENTMTRQ